MIIFLDIDGVLNPFGFNRRSEWSDATAHDVPTRMGTFNLLLSKELGQKLAGLPATILWTTTWQSEAPKVGEIVGINADFLSLGDEWKLGAIVKYIHHTPSPFVWVDDDEVDEWNKHRLDRIFDDPYHPRLYVRPDPSVGITKQEFKDIEEFVHEHKDSR